MSDAAVVQRSDGRMWVLRGSTWTQALHVGTVSVDFGVLPGSDSAAFVITTETDILSTSLVRANISLQPTVDHTADEARIENLKITAGAIVPGVGFTVYADCLEGLANGTFNVDWSWV